MRGRIKAKRQRGLGTRGARRGLSEPRGLWQFGAGPLPDSKSHFRKIYPTQQTFPLRGGFAVKSPRQVISTCLKSRSKRSAAGRATGEGHSLPSARPRSTHRQLLWVFSSQTVFWLFFFQATRSPSQGLWHHEEQSPDPQSLDHFPLLLVMVYSCQNSPGFPKRGT